MNIEDLIKQNRDQLNRDIPPDEMWNNIRKDWKAEKKQPHWWKVAAILFITLSLGLLINNISLQKQVDELASLSDISKEYETIEKSYMQQINRLESSIVIHEIESNEDYGWLLDELSTLEEINTLYRKDIGIVSEDHLVEVLIDYYEKKIRLLKKLDLEIKRANKFNENEETHTHILNS